MNSQPQQCIRGDIVAAEVEGENVRCLFLGYLHTGRAVVCRTLRSGDHIPLVLDSVRPVVHNNGYMPEYAPFWACVFGKGRKY